MDDFSLFLTSDGNEHEIINLYRDGYKISDIVDATVVPVASIYRILRKHGVKPDRISGLQNHEQVIQYRKIGVPVSKIAELTGYSRRQIYNIIIK